MGTKIDRNLSSQVAGPLAEPGNKISNKQVKTGSLNESGKKLLKLLKDFFLGAAEKFSLVKKTVRVVEEPSDTNEIQQDSKTDKAQGNIEIYESNEGWLHVYVKKEIQSTNSGESNFVDESSKNNDSEQSIEVRDEPLFGIVGQDTVFKSQSKSTTKSDIPSNNVEEQSKEANSVVDGRLRNNKRSLHYADVVIKPASGKSGKSVSKKKPNDGSVNYTEVVIKHDDIKIKDEPRFGIVGKDTKFKSRT